MLIKHQIFPFKKKLNVSVLCHLFLYILTIVFHFWLISWNLWQSLLIVNVTLGTCKIVYIAIVKRKWNFELTKILTENDTDYFFKNNVTIQYLCGLDHITLSQGLFLWTDIHQCCSYNNVFVYDAYINGTNIGSIHIIGKCTWYFYL